MIMSKIYFYDDYLFMINIGKVCCLSMEADERKEKFIALLKELLDDYQGVKIKLAQKLEINSSTLTRWFQGKVDPATLESINFLRISQVAKLSSDELARKLGMISHSEAKILSKFQDLVKSLLSSQSMEELGSKLGVTYGAIAGWLSSQKNINPQRIPIGTIIALAKEKGWTLERLFIYLDLQELKNENNLLFKLQSGANVLPLNDQVKLLAWLSDRVQEKVTQQQITDPNIKTIKDLIVCIILETENLAIGTNYATNLAVNLELEPDNIQVASIKNLPESLEEFDLLLFDISSSESEAIALIEEIEFEGNMIVFAPDDLPSEVMANLSARVSDVVIKPIDWSSLKDKEYFR